MGVDGRPTRGSKNGKNGTKNTGSSNNASTLASSSGSRSTSAGRTASHKLTSPARVRSTATSREPHISHRDHDLVVRTPKNGDTPSENPRAARENPTSISGRSS